MAEGSYNIADLLYLMQRLRDPQFGCPWDLRQTARSIAPSTLEEAFEVVDAIENGSPAELCDELGDLLFQVVFYAQLGGEQDQFDFNGVVDAIVTKLLRRHPHVFKDGELYGPPAATALDDEGAVRAQWEEIKQQERSSRGDTGLLDNIPLALSALPRAQKLQKRAASVGFDWENPREVLAALRAELDELEQAMAREQRDEMVDELGDVLFTTVNLARHLGVDAESAARAANDKFTRRFTYVERAMVSRGLPMEASQRPAMEAQWQAAKDRESSATGSVGS